MSNTIQGIILSAGKSTRFNTGKTKLIEKICGLEIITYPVQLLKSMNIPTAIVVGYQKELVINAITQHGYEATFVEQENQHGTGHALACTQDTWHADNILVMNGDAPLITQEIINNLYDAHISTHASISFVTSHINSLEQGSYGRVITKDNAIEIVEAKDLTDNTSTDLCCINAGIYLINQQFLRNHLAKLDKNNASKEFYITDLVKIASNNGLTVTTIAAPFDRIRGVNTFKELWEVEHIKKSELINYWMTQGVQFIAPHNVIIDLPVTIGAGTKIGSGVHILGTTQIGTNCLIDSFSIIENSVVAHDATIHSHTVIRDAHIGHHTKIGPFAHIHQNSSVKDHGIIGNFVELKNSTIGSYTKAKHLSYLGDATIGSRVNIGAGTITCNHDGVQKNKTIIEDGAYVGSNNALIAPVTVGKNSFTAAGSVITHHVPEDALAIARAKQVNKEGYAKKLRAKKEDNNFTFVSATKAHKCKEQC